MEQAITFMSVDRGYKTSAAGEFHSRAIFMLSDGQCRFVLNQNRWLDIKNEPASGAMNATSHLVKTNGAYFRLNGAFDCPLELLSWMGESGYHFAHDALKIKPGTDFTDIYGNLAGVSGAFKYRIYDTLLVEKFRTLALEIDPSCLDS